MHYCCRAEVVLTLLSAAPPLQSALPAVQLHPEGTAQTAGGLGVRDLHHVDVAVGGAEVAAVERRHLGFGLFEGGPGPVLQHPSKLRNRGTKRGTFNMCALNQGCPNYGPGPNAASGPF